MAMQPNRTKERVTTNPVHVVSRPRPVNCGRTQNGVPTNEVGTPFCVSRCRLHGDYRMILRAPHGVPHLLFGIVQRDLRQSFGGGFIGDGNRDEC